MALLPVLIACGVSRSFRGWKAAYLLSLVGVASHLLLDWTNAYGIRLFLPFSAQWMHLDATNVVDLWIWGVLLVCALGPALGKLVSAEIGAKPGSGRALAIFALGFLALYDYGRVLLHHRAIETLNSRIYQGRAPERVAAFPIGAANPMTWLGWVKTDDESIRYSMNLLEEFDPSSGRVIHEAPPSTALEAAKQTVPFRQFEQFAIYPLWRTLPVPDPQNGVRVDLSDWRFGFTATAFVDAANRVEKTSFHF
jgi:inner membrane protein